MVINQKVTGKAASIPGGLVIGGTISLLITLIAAACIAKMLDMGIVAWEHTGYWVLAMLLSASFAGARIAYGRIKRQRMLVSLLSGILYTLIMLSITALFFGGQYEAVGVTILIILAGSISSGILGGNANRGHKRPRLQTRHR